VSKQEKTSGGTERGHVYFELWQNVSHVWTNGKLCYYWPSSWDKWHYVADHTALKQTRGTMKHHDIHNTSHTALSGSLTLKIVTSNDNFYLSQYIFYLEHLKCNCVSHIAAPFPYCLWEPNIRSLSHSGTFIHGCESLEFTLLHVENSSLIFRIVKLWVSIS
jgi:hypothetical protein